VWRKCARELTKTLPFKRKQASDEGCQLPVCNRSWDISGKSYAPLANHQNLGDAAFHLLSVLAALFTAARASA
jgi:hypothetical protein